MQKIGLAKTLIYNANLVLPENLIENGWVLIENGRIVDLGRDMTRPENVKHQIDAASGYISCNWSNIFITAMD